VARRGKARQGKARQGYYFVGGIYMKEELNIFIGSDTHCGHDVGLTPPDFNWTPPNKAPRWDVKSYKFRIAGWKWFAREVMRCRPFDIAIWNGDLTDGPGESSGGVEDQEIPVQVDMAAECVRVVGARGNYFVRGTPYHVGKGKTTYEDMVCGMVGGLEIGAEGHYNFYGLEVAAKHHIGNSRSPISQFTAMSSARIKQLMWAETKQQPKANLIIRSHIHRCMSIAEPERNRAVWVTPALQGLGSVYGALSVDGLPVHFGFLILRVKSANDWGVEAHIAPMTMQKAHTVVYKKPE